MDLQDAFMTFLQGLGLIGNALSSFFIKYLLSLVGIDLPDWVIQVASIIVLIVTLLSSGSKLNKIVLVILVILLVSLGARLLSGFLKI